MKSHLATLFAALILASLVVACGGGGSDPSAAPAAAAGAPGENGALAKAQSAEHDECSTDQ